MTANDILGLLLDKHHKDICVPECKTGSTYGPGLRRIDLWVLKTSWAHPAVYGYEIKINRQDFLHDTKWQDYLEYCTDFYFACPPGVIEPNELPPEVGLLVSSVNGARLFTKKKATSRLQPINKTCCFIF